MGWQTFLAVPLAVATLGAAEPTSSPIALAVHNRDRAAVRSLLKQHADVNQPAPDGTTALHWAAHWNDSETAVLLIGAGAKVNALNRYGATPLWVAASIGNAAVVTTLLRAGADPNAISLKGETPLIVAALAGSVQTVEALLERGADVNAREAWRGQTALMMAVGQHEPQPAVARVLCDRGADVNIRSTGGMTALLFAVRQNDVESTRLLLNAGANVNDRAVGDLNALRVAIDNRHFALAELLIEKSADVNVPDKNGFTPLHAAIQTRAGGNPERGGARDGTDGEATTHLLKSLLARGADPNARLPLKRLPPNFNPDGYPQINNVQYGGATPFWIAAHLADLEAMRLLAAAGADPKLSSMESTTPLMVAAGLGYGTRGPTSRLGGRRLDTEEAVIAVVKQLLEWGNDINAVNDNGQNALHGATAAANASVAQFLIDHGIRLDQQDKLSRTPFTMADEHRTDKYRTNQSLTPERISATYALLRKLTGN
jgi:ankyrin repeat protein